MSTNPMLTHGAFSWMEHQGNAPKQAQEFYRNVLGWDVVDAPMSDGSTYPIIQIGDQKLGGFQAQENGQASWMPYVTVDDVDKRIETARQAGAQILAEPFTLPGVGRMATFADPNGAQLALISYEQPEESQA